MPIKNYLFCLRKTGKTDSADFLLNLVLDALVQGPIKAYKLWSLISVLAVLAPMTSVRASEAQFGGLCQNSLQSSTSLDSSVRTITDTDNEIEKVNPRFPVLNIDDWRKSQKIPWSVPVIINDPFDGKYLAVFDRNYKDGSGVITNWSRNCIRTVVYQDIPYYSRRLGNIAYYNGFSHSIPGYRRDLPVALTITAEAKTLEIRLGNQIFRLSGQNGNFLVDNKMAAALRNAPDEKAIIRITLEGSGASIVSDVGSTTVKAWKSVY